MMKKAEVVLDHCCHLGEGPVWDPADQRILWVDITEGKIHQFFTKEKKHKVFSAGQMVGAIAFTGGGELIAALQHGFFSINLETQRMRAIADPEANLPGNRFNDGKCDPAGRFWAGTMSVHDEEKAGKLYVLDTNGSVSVKIEDVTCSNGMAWSPDHKTFYYIDTGAQEVVAYDYNIENADITNKRSVIKIAPEEGFPDGMTVDHEGMLWVAIWGGWKVQRYDPGHGQLLDEIHLPVSLVTSCTFGGENLEDLYITTARKDLSEPDLRAQPLAGSLFVVRQSGYRGCEANYFLRSLKGS
ncbi:SMP-30/gluconolactonase/LRE family protein [Dyadobacter sp. CY323]|uniref:SMP-30/gluconolactonase/LRE family protein n=1 Tax=Dyadobacter sp. CY323 TaxID=2907302 RepID=UPI001F2E1C4D|nr:SMP-30/gluconolactonase/LRE family protein [Dyadobacter sp. CY323]MCE6991066.1 SMP-30/gluconolactonase/LRE family protein [Dyadobacter sp. CY323]